MVASQPTRHRGRIGTELYSGVDLHCCNCGATRFTVQPLERIAQRVFVPVVRASFRRVNEFGASDRGDSGFGSTGKK
ncbi:MAG: dUTP diphosphatase [Burkholderiaceae bacterium]|nr:dUTP diphosphatase [Burkholderiaceae bacterium]MDH3460812.1 dUTP diphosphatase [Burkholderiaceae bacterium]